MRVLVACEFSGVVREAFNAMAGVYAMSCDLLPAEDGRSDFHHQGDVRDVLWDGWDLMIAHPPCTYLTIAAEWAYGDGPYHQQVKPETLVGVARREARRQAYEFVKELADAPIRRIAIENPVGILSTIWRKPDQIIQPWQYGHDASKATCLWLKGLPKLKPTNELPGGRKARRGNQTGSGQNNLPPSPDRWKKRSLTYPGIAQAMAEQWGNYVIRSYARHRLPASAPATPEAK